jgi:murein DD-endopeptidase MepM/ murein hydrolase activator NlpD
MRHVSPPAAQDPADAAPMRTGRTCTQWFYEGKTDALWALFTPAARAAVPSAGRLADLRRRLAEQAGPEAAVVRESAREENGFTVYVRVARFQDGSHLQLRWRTDREGRVAGFLVRPEPAPTRFWDYETKTPLRLPFDGEWLVRWGGRTVEQNRHHVVVADQRFAYDFVVMRDGKRHDGDGSAPEQHYCFGLPILAPAAGTVVTAADGHADQPTGRMDCAHPPGNHVILDHGSGEFSLLAHLKQGSVAVRAGERVEAGSKLGECGNSGRTGRPHLHYHLQNTGELWRGEGLPAQFTGYVADGRPVERGEPVKGQTIRPR